MNTLSYSGKRYTGESLENGTEELPPYYPDDGLKEAIELARLLKKPLLLRSEPGCGKTRFAEALAFELYGENYQEYLYRWNIKSTTKAKEGIYFYDHLMELKEVKMLEGKCTVEGKEGIVIDKANFVKYGPLGNALRHSTEENPTILLIDEIDKAEIDFPNDLLYELEWKPGKTIPIAELGTTFNVQYPPIVIITSNDERELPPAFLRRCVFYYIDFPNDDLLFKIAKSYLAKIKFSDAIELNVAEKVEEFLNIRKKIELKGNKETIPSTSHMLDWLHAHAYYLLHKEDRVVRRLEDKLDFPGILFKSKNDLIRFT